MRHEQGIGGHVRIFGRAKNEASGVTNESAVGLPGLSESRRATWDYYRIEFMPDGYPGRRTGEILAAHPIYGAYVIADYLRQFASSGRQNLVEAACRVAHASIERMESLDDALVFRYEPNSGLSSLPHRFYSGLTQARYLEVLGLLVNRTGDERFREAAHAISKSLLIPAERGGVARTTPGGGTLIEEYSHDIPDYTLNGWATATLLADEYAVLTGDQDAAALVDASRRGIRDVLPLYDVPELFTSRYRLTGRASVRFDFAGVAGCQITDATVEIPGQGVYPVHPQGGPQWSNRFVRSTDPTQARIEAMLSRVSWPAPNRVRATITVPTETTLTTSIGQGPYRHDSASLVPTEYEVLASIPLSPGANEVDVPVPWGHAELVAYPTNFRKVIGGVGYNQYHFIHLDSMAKLCAREPDDLFAYYAHRWAHYVQRWPEVPEYAVEGIALDRRHSPPAPIPRN